MLNIVLPISKEFDKYKSFLDGVADVVDVKVFIGIKHKDYKAALNIYGQISNFNFFEFDNDEGIEQMINAMQDYLTAGAVMVLRKPISINEFNKIIKSDRDIVTSKKERNNLKAFFFKLWQKFTKLILGVKMYAGDFSMVYFNDDIADVVLRTGNLSYSSRVNRWKGVRQGVITTEGQMEKIHNEHALNLKYTIIAILLLAIGTIVTTLVSICVPMTIIIGLFLFCLDAICVAVAGIMITMLIFTKMTGKRVYRKAIIMNKKIESEEA